MKDVPLRVNYPYPETKELVEMPPGGSYELAVAATGEPRRIFFQTGASPAPARWDFTHDDATAPLFGLNAAEIRRTMRNRFERRDQNTAARGRNETRSGGIRSSGPPFRFITGQNEQGGVWQLHLKHRAGSLEAAVAKVRRRNLGVSFGILGVLAASVGLLLLSARGQVVDKILGLKLGADDYLTKPFNTGELLARIEAVLRRSPEGTAATADVFAFGDVRVDFCRAEVLRDGQPVELTAREYQLLRYLIENRESVHSRDDLLNAV